MYGKFNTKCDVSLLDKPLA